MPSNCVLVTGSCGLIGSEVSVFFAELDTAGDPEPGLIHQKGANR